MACPMHEHNPTAKAFTAAGSSSDSVSSAPSFPSSVPDSLRSVSWLLGRWRTDCSRSCPFPGMRDFAFGEELYFTCQNQPILCYRNKSWKPDGSALMHHESGFIRVKPAPASANEQQTVEKETRHVAFCLAYSFGDVEILEGKVEPNKLTLESTKIETTTFQHTAPILKTKRIYTYDESDDTLTFQQFMATSKVPELTAHIHAIYKRIV